MKLQTLRSLVFIFFLTGLFGCFGPGGIAQSNCILMGRVTDRKTNEPLIGATVSLDPTTGVSTNVRGFYQLSLPPGKYEVTYQFIGYRKQEKSFQLSAYDTIISNIQLEINIEVLEEIVVTAGKFEQKLSEVTVSMDLIRPLMIRQNNHVSMDMVINRIPGVDILDGQPSIRGGSGYSYGAGSRVLVLVDDLPILSADVGDVKWDFLPVENISGVEILKGASSVLYGSSALNGVINVRTAFPKPDPETNLNLFSGLYLDPSREALIWWDKQPLFYGVNMNHLRKIKQIDLVAGGNLFHNPGYRENEWDTWGRGNLKVSVSSRKLPGLTYGMNSSFMVQDKSDFLLWQDADSGAYRQNPDAVSELVGYRLNMDPFVTLRKKENTSHSLKARIFWVDNQFREDHDKDNKSLFNYMEYRYLRGFRKDIHWSAGFSGSYSNIVSNLYGNHSGTNMAVYSQLDARFFQRLKWSAGVRWETSLLDGTEIHSLPVFRTGLNFQVAEFTYLRASAGQGYRFPSVAEKYTATTISSLNIFPNPGLNPERGWSAEAGLKQGLKIGNWEGFADISGFWTEYKDMVEFTFGVYMPDTVQIPTLDHIGFKSLNVGPARINGFEVNLTLEGTLGPLSSTLLAGYTYMNPVDLNIRKKDSLANRDEEVLKYRYRHSLKGDIQITWKKISTGMTLVYRSFMVNVDEVFLTPDFGEQILPGYAGYREKNDKGEAVLDHRISWDISEKIRFSFITKNLLNNEVMGRPGDISPPRNITLQFSMKF